MKWNPSVDTALRWTTQRERTVIQSARDELATSKEDNEIVAMPNSEQTKRVPQDPKAIGQGTLVSYIHTRKRL
ncbi:MAG: hypothetical protein EAX87_01815 [Candidatus Thorarchaeota archaeon]|nr:hypothetical protein [Candidatus Thorarchaeota archaeon]